MNSQYAQAYTGVFKIKEKSGRRLTSFSVIVIIVILNLVGTFSGSAYTSDSSGYYDATGNGSAQTDYEWEQNAHLSTVSFEDLELPRTTFEHAHQTLEENRTIDADNKRYVHEYLNVLEEKFPDMDVRVFEHNLQTLMIDYEDVGETDILGEYEIYVNMICLYFPRPSQGELTYEEKTVLFHELTHAARITQLDSGRVFQFRDLDGYGAGVDEGMTEVFTAYLLSEEQDLSVFLKEDHQYLGYDKIPGECAKVLEALDGYYDFCDYFTKDIYAYKNVFGDGESKEIMNKFIEEMDQYRNELMTQDDAA